MEREKWAIAISWLIVAALLVWASLSLINAFSNFAPAIIAGIASVYVALINHNLTQQREIRLQHQKEKQKNYEKLLSVTADFIRDPENREIWDTIHLYSWVVGSQNVIKKTKEFTKKIDDSSLKSLLDSMRKDIGLDATDSDLMPEVFYEKKLGYLKTNLGNSSEKRSYWPWGK